MVLRRGLARVHAPPGPLRRLPPRRLHVQRRADGAARRVRRRRAARPRARAEELKASWHALLEATPLQAPHRSVTPDWKLAEGAWKGTGCIFSERLTPRRRRLGPPQACRRPCRRRSPPGRGIRTARRCANRSGRSGPDTTGSSRGRPRSRPRPSTAGI